VLAVLAVLYLLPEAQAAAIHQFLALLLLAVALVVVKTQQ